VLSDPVAQQWSGGGANCTVKLERIWGAISAGIPAHEDILATTAFSVAPGPWNMKVPAPKAGTFSRFE
jgi:hypothetical protein